MAGNMRAFINNFNLLTWTKKLSEDLANLGCEVIIVDNASDYTPLLEWYENCPFNVYILKHNYRDYPYDENTVIAHAPWRSGVIDSYNDKYYIVTDPDLNIDGVPIDMIEKLKQGIELHDVWKCGLSIEIEDLPDNDYTQLAKGHESAFWANQLDTGYYKADVSTTLAMYDRDRFDGGFLNAVRCPRPYTCRHEPYYATKENMSEEITNYMNTSAWNGWLSLLK